MRSQPRYGKGDRIGGRYQIHDVKMGGMGEVYFCLDLETIQPFALKTFQQRYLTNPKLRQAFENELVTWVALEKHPNIVRCFLMDILDNQPFMFLEWIAGEEGRDTDLRGWLRSGPLNLRLALDFTIDICRGLIHANEKQPGIVHRDLKPENILVAQSRLAKITDFGLAQIVQKARLEISDAASGIDGRRSLLGQGGVVGTPPYMAPEQWRAEPLDARSDIYAIGCILYELLIGNLLFQASNFESVYRLHEDLDIATVVKHQVALRPVEGVLAGCLAKQREDRFVTVDDLLQQLSLIYYQQFLEPPKSTPSGDEFTAVDHNNRAATYTDLQRYDEALNDLNLTIQLAPNYAIAYNNRGAVYAQLNRYSEALADYDRAIQLGTLDAAAYTNRGITHHLMQNYEQALADFDQAIQLDPTLDQIFYNRGNTYVELDRYREALADYNQAIRLNPTDAEAYLIRGNLYADMQQYENALADYDRALELNPANVEAYCDRGDTYSDLRLYAKALADFDRAIQLDPTNARSYYNRGVNILFSDSPQPHEALADFDRAIQLNPSYTKAYFNRGSVYANGQEYEKALANFNKVILLDPHFVEAYHNRGLVCSELQDYSEALADFNRAIELDPTYSPTYISRAKLYAKLRRYSEALIDLEQAAQVGNLEVEQYVVEIKKDLAFEAFENASSFDEIRRLTTEYPFMTDSDDFIIPVQRFIAQQIPPEHRPAYEQRLSWLKQIASEQGLKE